MLKFIVDTQLPPKLAKFLSDKGYDAIHTTFYPDGHLLEDEEIITIAQSDNRIVITKDNDFMDYYLLKGIPPCILLLQFGNLGNKELMRLFSLNIVQIDKMFTKGSEIILFSRTKVIEYKTSQ